MRPRLHCSGQLGGRGPRCSHLASDGVAALSRGAPKRRLRVRRARKAASVVAEAAGDAGGEVVAQLGCCLVEAVASASVLVGLLLVPTYLLLS